MSDALTETSRPKARSRRRTIMSLLAAFMAFALIAAACGNDDDDDDDSSADDTEQDDSSAGDDDGDTADPGTPVHGGRLIYGIEADTANPWPHYQASCALSCTLVMRSITDTLFVADDNLELTPYLVEPGSVTSSDDRMEWSFAVREGITFTDGTPFDGAAVAYNTNLCRFSPLTFTAFLGVSDVIGEGQQVTVTYDQPSALGPTTWRGTCALMYSPAWLSTLASNPLLTDEQKAAATGDSAAPIGLGAFMLESYTPGNGNSFVAVRNPDYWRGPNGITGEELPYLDEIEFVVSVDIQGRSNAVKSGEFDIIHTANADEIAKYQENPDGLNLSATTVGGETNYILLNVAQGNNPTQAFLQGVEEVAMDPNGFNTANPLVHLSCRRALAHAIDRDRFAQERGAGLVLPANGPFGPDENGYLADTGYPDFDVAAAQAEFENCKTDSGQNPVAFSFNTSNDAFNVENNELVVAMWREAFGDEIAASIAPIEQGSFINLALAGVFQAQSWRNHGGVDPVDQWFWWHSASSLPIDPPASVALNFGRFQDPVIDAAIGVLRQSPDQAARIEAAEAISRSFGENVWNLWTNWTLWGVVSAPQVQNLYDLSIPGHDVRAVAQFKARHWLPQVYCTGGEC